MQASVNVAAELARIVVEKLVKLDADRGLSLGRAWSSR
jgi:hypothetical protein